jgi:hypothetical protein
MNSHRFSRFVLAVTLTCALFSFSASAAPHGGGFGQLVVKRSANFGLNLTLSLWVDGRPVDRLQIGHAFRATLPAGPHEIRAAVSERRLDSSPTVRRVIIQSGITTQLTAGFHGQDLVLQ